MVKTVALRFIILVKVIFLLIYSCQCQFYSERTKCSQNKLSFDSEISLFYQNTQFSGVNYTEIIDVMGIIKKLYHYGQKVNQTSIPTHHCQNYFLDNDICCRYSDLDQFTNKMISLYNRTYFTSKHPIIDYMYKIYDQYKLLNSSCLNNYDMKIPQRNGTTFDNATAPLGDLFKKISLEIQQIKNFQLDFIINSACTLCIGIEDFKSFLYPTNTDLTRSNRLIFNQEYFTNATQFIAQRMLNSKLYADQIQTFIIEQLIPKLSNTSQCVSLTSLVTNSTEIAKRKVCQSLDECTKFAEKFIGAPGAPAYSKTFTSISQNRGITKTNYKIISTTNGFKGNQTYNRYLSNSVPLISIKGNQYTYS